MVSCENGWASRKKLSFPSASIFAFLCQKLMLQAIKEAGRLTKMIHALPMDLEATSLFLTATSKDWTQAATLLTTPPRVLESVRQAIRHSLLTPCAGNHLEDELSPPRMSPPEKPFPATGKGLSWRRLKDAVITRPTAQKTATSLQTITDLEVSPTLEKALVSTESLPKAQGSRAAPN
jgi:hypothetical protein